MLLLDITLGIVIIVIFILVSTAISALWVKVPFVPTPKKTAMFMIEAAGIRENDVVYDVGAGDGRMLIWAKKLYPTIRATGFEIVPVVWFFGWLRIKLSGVKVDLKFKNSFSHDLSDANCVFLYMINYQMPKFAEKFDVELKKGTRVISHAFSFHGRTPKRVVSVPGLLWKNKVYVYEW